MVRILTCLVIYFGAALEVSERETERESVYHPD